MKEFFLYSSSSYEDLIKHFSFLNQGINVFISHTPNDLVNHFTIYVR
jgi:hypothetical protein